MSSKITEVKYYLKNISNCLEIKKEWEEDEFYMKEFFSQ